MLLSKRSWIPALAILATAFALAGCVDSRTEEADGVAGFAVEFNEGQTLGDVDSPLTFPTAFECLPEKGACTSCTTAADCDNALSRCVDSICQPRAEYKTVYIDIEAKASDGSTDTSQNKLVELKVVPGEVNPEDTRVELKDGVAKNVPVRIRYTFDEARIWVQDSGISDVDTCSDGIDNDGNGLIDFPTDPQCDTDDSAEGGGAFTTGISKGMRFERPTIQSVQLNPDSASGPSPLLGQYVEITGREGHDLVVTNVVNTGFFVTDLSIQNYNSLFIFNFSFPEDVEIGDRICEVGGGVVEFNALTQLQFPSWAIQGKVRPNSERRVPNPEDEEDRLIDDDVEVVDCSDRYDGEISNKLPEPDPVLLTPERLRDLELMEKLEGSVVTVENVELSTTFINCDDNGSSRIESGTAEADCRNTCNQNPFCTELSSLFGFDQWRGQAGGRAEISVSSTKLVAGFDVLAACERGTAPDGREMYTCPERTLQRVTGSLRQIVPTCDRFLPCDPADESIVLFIIDPRFGSDIVE